MNGGLEVYECARAIVGADCIVGIGVGNRRHDAMEASEAGADFVVIDQSATRDDDESIIAWWAEVMQVPCVTQYPCTAAEMNRLAAACVDFVRPLDAMWDSPQSARQVITEACAAITGAGQ